jgi:hypothetical protein
MPNFNLPPVDLEEMHLQEFARLSGREPDSQVPPQLSPCRLAAY